MTQISVGDALDAKLSSSDPSGSAKSVAFAVGGVALLLVVGRFGFEIGDWITDRIDEVAGTSAGSGGGITFDGAP